MIHIRYKYYESPQYWTKDFNSFSGYFAWLEHLGCFFSEYYVSSNTDVKCCERINERKTNDMVSVD